MTQSPTQDTTKARPARLELRNRYMFKGTLKMQTGLHIGGGKATLSHTDSPVVLTPDGLPYIPGSSFKGTLRSTIEKIVASLPQESGLRSCGLPTEETPHDPCPTAHQSQIVEERRKHPDNVEQILREAREKLCHTCLLFGSPYAAARITINDLALINDEWSGTTQIRDGVAIDRDSETAKSGLKYDFEVVPSTTAFGMRLVLENASDQDLQLIAIGLSEFMSGFAGVGGFRSRGLGACILKDLTIRYMDLGTADSTARKQRLQRYLSRKLDGTEDGLDPFNTQTFFTTYIDMLFKEEPPRP